MDKQTLEYVFRNIIDEMALFCSKFTVFSKYLEMCVFLYEVYMHHELESHSSWDPFQNPYILSRASFCIPSGSSGGDDRK